MSVVPQYTVSGEHRHSPQPISGQPLTYGEMYSAGLSGAGPFHLRSSRVQPIRVSHVGPSFVCAGVESWLRALVSHSDPTAVEFVRNVVTEDYAIDFELLQQLGIPYTTGRDQAVCEAVLESDIVLVWGPVSPEYLCPKGSTAKVVFVAHGMGGWTQQALSACSPAVNHVVAVSSSVQHSLPTDLPTSVILNGVDQRHIASRESRSRTRKQLGFSDDDFVVGYVGRFSPEKQAHIVVDAVSRLDPKTKALFVGWGPLRYPLIDQCNEQIPGRFAFANSRVFLGDYYQVIDALCVPSAEEGFGLVIAEAMLHGVPVISTSVGVAAELFEHRVNGLIASADADDFADNLKQLQRHPEWGKGLGNEGRRTAVEHCLASTMARKYQELLQSLV